jgi:hypothetical protein
MDPRTKILCPSSQLALCLQEESSRCNVSLESCLLPGTHSIVPYAGKPTCVHRRRYIVSIVSILVITRGSSVTLYLLI